MDVLVVGLSLRSVALPELEAVQSEDGLREAERRLRSIEGVRELVRLATCQRVEFVLGCSAPHRRRRNDEGPLAEASRALAAVVESESHAAAARAAALRGSSSTACRPRSRAGPERPPRRRGAQGDDPLESYRCDVRDADERLSGPAPDRGRVYGLAGAEAYHHLLRLATGLDSFLQGETEILGQIRTAYAAASERGHTGPLLNPLFHRVFRAARRIRARASLEPLSPTWGESLAATIAAESDLRAGDSLHVIGTGRLARALTVSLQARGLAVVTVEAAPASSGLRNARVLITASGRGRLLGPADFGWMGASPSAADERGAGGTGSLDIWDLGMPRNIDPAAAAIPGVRLRSLADLVKPLPASGALAGSLALAEREVEEETAAYAAWRRSREMTPSIVRLGRLLELSGAAGPRAGGDAGFRQRLLQGFIAIANEAQSEDEAVERLSLFEELLRRAEKPRPAGGGAEKLPGMSAASLPPGAVSLVGAGPGDPSLLTLRAHQRLSEADVVYYDALVAPEVLGHCRPGARLVPVGKRRAAATATQERIQSLLVRDARAGLAVVRLKGGDPFVFGRGGEEALALLAAGVPFEIVPGVSSGIAVPALAGIPLTHRGLASSAAFLTAHDLANSRSGGALRARLAHLARGADTLVLFMAGAERPRVKRTLLQAGLAANTPAAMIESGSTADQKISIGTVGGLDALGCPGGEPRGPVLLVVGRTVSLSSRLRADSREEGTGAPSSFTRNDLLPEQHRGAPADSRLAAVDPPARPLTGHPQDRPTHEQEQQRRAG